MVKKLGEISRFPLTSDLGKYSGVLLNYSKVNSNIYGYIMEKNAD